jgi:hypothetical protein
VHVEALMALRGGIPAPKCVHDRPLVRGKCKWLALSLLPCTMSVVADAIQLELPDITRKSAVKRAYQAFLRLEDMGVVYRNFGQGGICGGLFNTREILLRSGLLNAQFNESNFGMTRDYWPRVCHYVRSISGGC